MISRCFSLRNHRSILFQLLHQHSTTEAFVESKPPLKVNIESMRILRQMNGQIIIRDDQKPAADTVRDNSPDLQLLRTENERLRAELTAQKTEITVLRGERDSLMHTISKLDIELTQAEFQRASQQQQLQQQKPRKK